MEKGLLTSLVSEIERIEKKYDSLRKKYDKMRDYDNPFDEFEYRAKVAPNVIEEQGKLVDIYNKLEPDRDDIRTVATLFLRYGKSLEKQGKDLVEFYSENRDDAPEDISELDQNDQAVGNLELAIVEYRSLLNKIITRARVKELMDKYKNLLEI